MTVTVKVVVYEDDQEVGATNIRYFEGQDYIVKIDTGDGVDAQVVCTAGGSGSSVSDRLHPLGCPVSCRELQAVRNLIHEGVL